VGSSDTALLIPIDRSDMSHNELPKKTGILDVAANILATIRRPK
jgi:hypothetical protein